MKWSNVKLIFHRELRDQLRDRRTLFTIAVLPLLLYPLLGMSFLQIAQFTQEHPTSVWIVGARGLPESPRLLDESGKSFAAGLLPEANLLKLTVDDDVPELQSDTAISKIAESHIHSGKYDAIIYFPPHFGEQLARFRADLLNPRQESIQDIDRPEFKVPEPAVFVDTASDKSRIAAGRVNQILRRWRDMVVADNLKQRHIPIAATIPFQLAERDVAKEVNRRAAVWSKILPFVVLIWALTGAFYPAIDLCAGEKERGTLETLLSSPAERSEIVWGKLLTIMSFSIGTSVLNLLSMGFTGTFIMSQMQRMGVSSSALDLGQPPLFALAWLTVAIVPISGLFSALSLAVSAFARSSKEGQYYLMPLLLISLPLMLLPMLPTTELDLGTSLIPVTGVMLLLRSLIEGQYWDAFRYSIPVIGVTSVCCLLAIRWAIDQFNNESVLFRESERWGLGIWLRHLVRDRQNTPSASEAILCGVLLLLINFVASLLAVYPASWWQFAQMTFVRQAALIATPVVLMAIMLTRSPRATLLLNLPQPLVIVASILLALCIHPLGMAFAQGVQWLYPIGQDLELQLRSVSTLISRAPNWLSVVGLLALTPAICEELAFRGFVLSGLRHTGHKWLAIVVSSLFFGAAHGLLQQSLSATALGMVIGYLAVQTGSLLPCILFHFFYNALGVLMSLSAETLGEPSSMWSWLFQVSDEGIEYRLPVVIISAILSGTLLIWFRSLPYAKFPEEQLQSALDHQTVTAPVATPK